MAVHSVVCARLIGTLLLALISTGGQAATVFGSIFTDPGKLVRIDTTSHTVTPILTTGSDPDSLIFDTSGRLIYTVFGANQVRRFDPATSSDTLISGGFSGPLDLALEPGGQTVLVSNNTGVRIDRLNLSTGVTTPFFTNGGGGGITYDTSGRLFAVIPGLLVQLDPVTAAVLQTTPGVITLDGLAFDPVTGSLYATDGEGGHIFRFNPNNLAAGGQLLATLIPSGGFVDGLEADGAGNLLVAARVLGNEAMSGLFQVNDVTGAFTQIAFAPLLDDIAPLKGLGAPPPGGVVGGGTAAVTPVPTLAQTSLAGLVLLILAVGLWRVRRGGRA